MQAEAAATSGGKGGGESVVTESFLGPVEAFNEPKSG
jgi:hypothetical protein